MGTKRIYVTLVTTGAVLAVGGILMKFSASPPLHAPGTILGWSGIGVILMARILFGRRRPGSASSTPKNRL